MDLSLLVLIEFGFLFAGCLPAYFFKSGAKKNLKWFLSCIPFFVLPLLILSKYILGGDSSITVIQAAQPILNAIAVLCCITSILLINWSVLSHQIAIPLWHQEEHQLPESIVTSGPYQFIRHPFYSAYLLLFLSVTLAWIHWSTIILLVWGIVAIAFTAKQEERKLTDSELSLIHI